MIRVYLPSPRELAISPFKLICSQKFYSILLNYSRTVLFYTIEISVKRNNQESLLTKIPRMVEPGYEIKEI